MLQQSVDSVEERRRLLVDYLRLVIEHNGAYHNHKETMIWTALSLYLAAVGAATVFIATGHAHPIWLITMTILVVAVSVPVGSFLDTQLDAKRNAGEHIEEAKGILIQRIQGEYANRRTRRNRLPERFDLGRLAALDDAPRIGARVDRMARSVTVVAAVVVVLALALRLTAMFLGASPWAHVFCCHMRF